MKRRMSLALVLTLIMTSIISMPLTWADESTPAVTTEAVTTAMEVIENRVDILTFNDFHGNVAEDVRDWGKNIGMAKMVGYVNAHKMTNPNTLVVSGGDNYQGTAMSNLTHGAPVTEMFKALDLTASAVGNHEFDWGVELIEKWAKDGDFTYLASNIYDKTTQEPVEWAKPYTFEEKAGLKIAFIGLAHPDTATLTAKENVENVEFKDAVEAAQIWVDFLKAGNAEEGTPDVIIALTHLDSKQDRDTSEITGTAALVAESVEGIDAVVSAHSHKTVAGKVNGVPVVQAYKYGRTIGMLSINLDEAGKVTDITASVDNVYKTKNDIIADPSSNETLAEFETELEPILGELIGEAGAEFSHEGDNVTILGQWATKVMAEEAGVQIGFQNGGGLRRSMYQGDIKMGDMYEIMPFDNLMVTFDLPGADVKKAIDHGILNPDIRDGSFYGLIVEYDPNAEFENRVVSVKLADGTELEDDKLYSCVANDFMFFGGDKYDFSSAQNIVETYVPIRDVFVNAIKDGGTLYPEAVKSMKVAATPVNYTTYVVKADDMLWKIAKAYNTTFEKLAEMNNIEDPNMINEGATLKVPAL